MSCVAVRTAVDAPHVRRWRWRRMKAHAPPSYSTGPKSGSPRTKWRGSAFGAEPPAPHAGGCRALIRKREYSCGRQVEIRDAPLAGTEGEWPVIQAATLSLSPLSVRILEELFDLPPTKKPNLQSALVVSGSVEGLGPYRKLKCHRSDIMIQ